MESYLIFLALAVALLSLVFVIAACVCCRKMVREKERHITKAVREQERLIRELALTRSEERHLWQVLTAKRPAWEVGATDENPADSKTQRFDTPYIP